MHNAVWPLFTSFSWQELRHHPWRNAAAVVAVMLGVALAFAVHVINASALGEFTRGVRSVAGQAEVQVSGPGPVALDEALYGRLARHPEVQSASPVLELSTSARLPAGTAQAMLPALPHSEKPHRVQTHRACRQHWKAAPTRLG